VGLAICALSILKALIDGTPIDWNVMGPALTGNLATIFAKDYNVTGGPVQNLPPKQ
jgi:hypothetical protein